MECVYWLRSVPALCVFQQSTNKPYYPTDFDCSWSSSSTSLTLSDYGMQVDDRTLSVEQTTAREVISDTSGSAPVPSSPPDSTFGITSTADSHVESIQPQARSAFNSTALEPGNTTQDTPITRHHTVFTHTAGSVVSLLHNKPTWHHNGNSVNNLTSRNPPSAHLTLDVGNEGRSIALDEVPGNMADVITHGSLPLAGSNSSQAAATKIAIVVMQATQDVGDNSSATTVNKAVRASHSNTSQAAIDSASNVPLIVHSDKRTTTYGEDIIDIPTVSPADHPADRQQHHPNLEYDKPPPRLLSSVSEEPVEVQAASYGSYGSPDTYGSYGASSSTGGDHDASDAANMGAASSPTVSSDTNDTFSAPPPNSSPAYNNAVSPQLGPSETSAGTSGKSVSYELVFGLEAGASFADILGDASSLMKFKQDLVKTIAASTGVPAEQIIIRRVWEGSIHVDILIMLPENSSASQIAGVQSAFSPNTMVSLFDGAFLAAYSIQPDSISVKLLSSDSSSTQDSTADGLDKAKIIGIGVGAGVGGALVFTAVITAVVLSRRAKQKVELQEHLV